MKDIQALREKIGALASEARALVENNEQNWTAEKGEKYDSLIQEINDLKASVKRREELNALEFERREDQSVAEHVDKQANDKGGRVGDIYNKFLRQGMRALTVEDWGDIRATMSTTTGSEGGYSVPITVASRLIDSLKFFGGMRQVATVFSTSAGNDMSFLSSDGTAEVGEIVAQNAAATAADPTFGTVPLVTYKWSSKVVAVPIELLQDSVLDIAGFIEKRLAQRIGRIQNTKFTVGTGTAEPFGVVSRAAAGRVGATGQTLTVTFDDLELLKRSVDVAYRDGGSPKWMMSDASMGIVSRLKDTAGRPIFLPGFDGLANATPDRILGYPVVINNDVAAMAANAKSILFGDFSYYNIRDVMDVSMFRFEDSAYMKNGQIGFLAWARAGGNLLDTAAVKYYQNSAT